MSSKGQKQSRPSRRRALELIGEGLTEIENEFQWQGFSPEDDDLLDEETADESAESEGETSDDEEIDFDSTSTFNSEDVEVAMDVFVSRLVREKIIRSTPTQLPSFSRIFEKFFGKDHEVTKLAEAFEELVQGYFGAIHYQDMQQAHRELLEIRKIVDKELGRSGR